MSHLVDTLEKTSAALLAALDEKPSARRLLEGDVDTDVYAEFLRQTHLYVRHTRPLLRRAGERLRALSVYPAFASLFLQKADEEDGHDAWLARDLAAIGRPLDNPDALIPSDAVKAYVAWNHFQVSSGDPLGFLGTAYVLERLSTTRAATTAKNLVARGRIPGIAQGVSFLVGHADADEGHTEALGRALESIESPSSREAIALSASVTASLYAGMFDDAQGLNEGAKPGG